MWPLLSTSDNYNDVRQSHETETALARNILLVVALMYACVCVVYALMRSKLKYLPESIAIIVVGAALGLTLRLTGHDLSSVLEFDPEIFFLFLLPPIIFDSGYSLHKGSFFANIGSILLFAIVGTLISTVLIGTLVFAVGQAGLSYDLPLLDSLIFGALISAVDPVATLAIFHALDVDPTLYMLVFGESVLNDAIAVVLYRTLVSFIGTPLTSANAVSTIFKAIGLFCLTSFASVAIGIITASLASLVLKHIRFRDYPSLECTVALLSAYVSYLIAETFEQSGILAILTAGLLMSTYSHYNLSPSTQVTVQQTVRTLAFCSESFVFLYLGLSIFASNQRFSVPLIFWSILFCLLARAANVFPLAKVANRFRQVKIPRQFIWIVWWSGLRGAIAFALALNTPTDSKDIIVSTTLVIVLCTIFVFGGGTLPLLRMLKVHEVSELNMSKTAEVGDVVDVHNPKGTTAYGNMPRKYWPNLSSFERLDDVYLRPFFCIDEETSANPIETDPGTNHVPLVDAADPGAHEMAVMEHQQAQL